MPAFFAREAERLKAAGRSNVAANQASDEERLKLLMASLPCQASTQPSTQPTNDWLPLNEAEPETSATDVAIEQIGTEPFIPGQESTTAEPAAELPTEDTAEARVEEQAETYDPEEERQAEALAAAMLDAADQAYEPTESTTPKSPTPEESAVQGTRTDHSTAEDTELDFLNWDETKPRRQRAHITASARPHHSGQFL